MPTELDNTPPDADEISLLDIAVVIAENIKLLVLAPIAAGLLALVATYLMPNTYESVAILKGDDAAVSVLHSAAVLDPVIAELQLSEGLAPRAARERLDAKLIIAAGRKDGLITLRVNLPDPQLSQKVAQAIIESYLKTTVPRGVERARLQVRLEKAMAFSSKLNTTMTRAFGTIAAPSGQAQTLDPNLGTLIAAAKSASDEIDNLEVLLAGLDESMFVKQPPTRPELPVSRKKAVIATVTTLAAGFLLLLFVFVRNALSQINLNSSDQEKLIRIRKSLGRC